MNLNDPDQELDLDLDTYLTENPDGTKTLKLEYPFAIGEKVGGGDWQDRDVKELNFRRPKAGDLDLLEKITDKNVFAPTRVFVAALCGIAAETLRKEMDAVDSFRALEVSMGFLPKPKKKKSKTSNGSLVDGDISPEN